MAIAADICVYTNDKHHRSKRLRDAEVRAPIFQPARDRLRARPHIVGQNDAKRAVAIALRNRWRRQQLPEELRDEVLPKNILMIGPTGFGKTEIARRLAKLAQAPFLKVEATKFTEVGYVGRDVEQIMRDLVEIAIGMTRERLRKEVEAQGRAGRRGARARRAGRPERRRRTRAPTSARCCATASSTTSEIEVEVADTGGAHADLRDPGHARRPDGHAQSRRHDGQGVRRPHQDRAR